MTRAYPEDYVVPKVWEWNEPEGGSMNQPTAGPRKDEKLPKGEHDLQLYSLGTPNGQKITIFLEELNDLKGVEYDAFKISFSSLDQFGSQFVEINPNSKIPALLDTSMSPPLRIFESGSILKYLAEKYEVFVPKDPRAQVECFNWLFWQVGSAPYVGGGFGHFYRSAPVKIQYAIDRFTVEVKRQMDVLDKHLADKTFICGAEISIADFAVWPWINALYKMSNEFLQMDSYENVKKWRDLIAERPAVKRGIRVNGFGDDAVPERHSRADFD